MHYKYERRHKACILKHKSSWNEGLFKSGTEMQLMMKQLVWSKHSNVIHNDRGKLNVMKDSDFVVNKI